MLALRGIKMQNWFTEAFYQLLCTSQVTKSSVLFIILQLIV